MSRKKIWFLALLMISLIYIPGCANRSSSGNSSTLVHGFGSSDNSSVSSGEVKVVKVVPEVVAIHDGRADKLQAGMMVPSSAILRSNESGSAELSFSNGATVKVSPNSEIALSSVAPAAAASREDAGAGKSLSRKLSSVFGRSGSQSTKQATIGVRGLK